MNLRISENQLRFRITREELDTLLQGAALELLLPLAKGAQHYQLRAEECAPLLLLEENDRGFTLVVGRTALASFAEQLPSREGIEHQVGNLLLVLEVDVRRRK